MILHLTKKNKKMLKKNKKDVEEEQEDNSEIASALELSEEEQRNN